MAHSLRDSVHMGAMGPGTHPETLTRHLDSSQHPILPVADEPRDHLEPKPGLLLGSGEAAHPATNVSTDRKVILRNSSCYISYDDGLVESEQWQTLSCLAHADVGSPLTFFMRYLVFATDPEGGKQECRCWRRLIQTVN